MSKIICEICGTTYPDTAECCPICGYHRDPSVSPSADEFVLEEETMSGKGGRFSSNKRKKEIFDFDEANADSPEPEDEVYSGNEEEDEEVDDYEQESGHNTFAVVILTVLIVVLLSATAFLFFRFLLPNLRPVEETTQTVVTEAVMEQTETTELRIPCQSLSLPGGAAELSQPGYYFLLNVVVKPEDTTDELTFTSGDENVATVSADGRITAVGEGETVIYITCGDKQLACPVTCKFTEEAEPPTEESVEAQAESVEETTEETTLPDVELKLDREDMRLMVGYGTQLQLVDCGELKPEDVEWNVEHEYIAKVENGYVTALQNGTTEVTATYGGQTVKCIVRCYS